MALSLTTAPTVEPLSTQNVKDELEIDHTASDDRIDTFLLPSARQLAETLTHRAFLEQTYILRLAGFPAGPIILPRPPLTSVSSVQYVDTAGDTQTWAASKYAVETPSGERALHGTIQPGYNEVYPSTRQVPDAVIVTFKAGYGTTAGTVPVAVRQGVALLVKWLYFEDLTHYEAADTVLFPYRAWRADLEFN